MEIASLTHCKNRLSIYHRERGQLVICSWQVFINTAAPASCQEYSLSAFEGIHGLPRRRVQFDMTKCCSFHRMVQASTRLFKNVVTVLWLRAALVDAGMAGPESPHHGAEGLWCNLLEPDPLRGTCSTLCPGEF